MSQPRADISPNSVAIVHDLFRIRGGGERLILALANGMADALCFGYDTEEGFNPHELFNGRVYDLDAQGGPIGYRTFKLMHAFRYRTTFLRDYHTVIYSGILSPVAIANHTEGVNILYCHTPPRFAYDKYEAHLALLAPWKRPLMQAYVPVVKRLYEPAVSKMDLVIANSEHVRARIKQYLGCDAKVAHPPIDTSRFSWKGQGDYYLSTGRMDPLKRIDVVINAFKKMPDKKLVVASGGTELEKMKALAEGAPNITFTGWLSEEGLLDLVGNCIATIYIPQDEDFGMSPVESMAAGKPVIGVNEGGMPETQIPGQTGYLLPPAPTPEDLIQTVEKLTPKTALDMRETCEARAKEFDESIFLARMKELVASVQ